MKKNIYILALLLGLAAVVGLMTIGGQAKAADNPLAASIDNPTEGESFMVGTPVNFAASATGGAGDYMYAWDFGDGSQLGGQNYTKSYADFGDKTITLKVTDIDNNLAIATRHITITKPALPPLHATITSPADGASFNLNENINFAASATGGAGDYMYAWDFGDGSQLGGQNYTKSYNTAGTKNISLKVTDIDNHEDTATASITINNQPPATSTPTVDLKANGQDGSLSITSGNAINLTWTSTNATACNASGNWSGAQATSGATTTAALAVGNYSYTLACLGTGGTATDTVAVSVTNGGGGDTTPPSAPTIVSASPTANATSTSGVSTITWTDSTDNTGGSGLAGYSFVWDNNTSTVPDQTVDSTATTTTTTLANGSWYFHLIALDNSGNASTPVTHYGPVIITGTTPTTLTISNISVTDVTQTSAIIHWTTNLPANSRVIYDTTSHSSITGASAPNYGYAFSTGTSDTNPLVTTHAVTVSGLAANTTYYFRIVSTN